MSRTAEALGKLSERQTLTLEAYQKSMMILGNYAEYRNRIHGYISALEDSGIVSTVDARLLKIYFTL